MVITEITSLQQIPLNCSSPQDRARREAATRQLLQARVDCTDETQRQRLLEQAVELNIEIARGIARRFRNRGPEDDDLEQVAYLGLLKAVRGFRLDDGTPFIGFAVPTIRGEIKRYFRDCSWTVRIPRRLQELQGTIAAALPALEQELGREPSHEEIAGRTNVPVAEVEQALAARGCFNVLSLDRPNGYHEGGEELPLSDTLRATDDSYVEQLEAVDMLNPLLEDLAPRDRRLLELRFIEGWTQADIGKDIGVSQMQVSRLLTKLLADLREQLAALSPAA
ncbi:sigma-70 family RNA polymerase sigma factor [Kribbella qitaiheensis]|uniref:Sigma-70 family RNA polymerase sigma factor n=1 Tax=Kribbella qitaiheensis TaxID=1544730 RepID=A0A7G6X583_9ACTN|nr:sigma-70 family RNA polymerase sigma factor [Kribbella qitaiheensis]QNE21398.1 sigma-70 family RNA polymerase sigma factor [Kribbella qitaiheensis]